MLKKNMLLILKLDSWGFLHVSTRCYQWSNFYDKQASESANNYTIHCRNSVQEVLILTFQKQGELSLAHSGADRVCSFL